MTRSFSRKNWKRAKAWTARRTSRVTGPTKNTLIDRLESFSRPHSSTVALIPPEDAWTSLQRTRELLSDKGIYRWPPHINLLCESRSRRVFSLVSLVQSLASLRVDPFLPPQVFSEAVQLLAPAAASVKPFEVTLDALGVFGGKRRGVLYAYSSDPDQTRALIELQATLQAAIPFLDHQQRNGTGFTPHLTLAHFDTRIEAEAVRSVILGEATCSESPNSSRYDSAALSAVWAPVTFTVGDGAVHVMSRNGSAGQFMKAATLPLRGSGRSRSGFGFPRRLSKVFRRLARAVLPQGVLHRFKPRSGLPEVWNPPRRFESMPEMETESIRAARKDTFRPRAKGRKRKGGRRSKPRRSDAERAAIRARSPQEIASIRAARAQKKEVDGQAPRAKEQKGAGTPHGADIGSGQGAVRDTSRAKTNEASISPVNKENKRWTLGRISSANETKGKKARAGAAIIPVDTPTSVGGAAISDAAAESIQTAFENSTDEAMMLRAQVCALEIATLSHLGAFSAQFKRLSDQNSMLLNVLRSQKAFANFSAETISRPADPEWIVQVRARRENAISSALNRTQLG
eukprot:CAMPEP_0172589756 /NCGR_PEP_ID=MMETSP1068-20121228/8357_1 /TAXON_ID=35684 /ORGANISM="Pseudopedinella elastica, Strain CCMP716" /LENGTH=571 /DNA_ID=CAMNT_0013385405 /DNA_START=217 /DNA_END=1929 /DNA_ORIENTATION=+